AGGRDVVDVGICPTPALAWSVARRAHGAGVMVSASHNPAPDNGLKVLDPRGLKLDEEREEALEERMDADPARPGPGNAAIGRMRVDPTALDAWRADRLAVARALPADLRIAVDAAHGSASGEAGPILAASGASVRVHYASPDGANINEGCGATHPEALAAIVRAEGGDLGVAFDGDADRCVAVDETGAVVDGDRLIGILALDRLERGHPGAGTVVVSILSNGGLRRAIAAAGGRVVETPVGDRWILDEMVRTGAAVGGEKSGHIILPEHGLCGDGILTALALAGIVARTGLPVSALAARIELLPQVQRAVPVARLAAWASDTVLTAAIADAQAELGPDGRLLVRASGTEPVLRVMAEGEDGARIARIADGLIDLARERLGTPVAPRG
ncbi:MAG: phosphoglucosamine mutase, partial [Chloroflexota bacterium]